MKLSKRDLGLLLILLGLAIILVCYFAIYSPNQTKNEELKGEIASLKPVLAELKAKEAKVPVYRDGIEESKEFIQSIKDSYPGWVKQEDFIMYTVAIEDNIGLDTEGLSFISPTLLEEFEPIYENNQVVFEGISAYQAGISVNANLTYEHMKELVGFVYGRSVQTTLDSLNISYNAENGVLLGTLNISKYYMITNGDPYIETYVPPMPIGVPNPFNSLSELNLIEDENGNGEGDG